MGNDHHHHHHHPKGSKNILIAFALNATFAVIELIGGFYTNSVAIMSDALHDFGDSLALLFAYFAERISKKEADDIYTFGYRRFSILSALINGIILLSGSIFVIYQAIYRILEPEPVKADGMLVLAILGIFVNAFAAYRLSKDDGLNPRMVMLHLIEDLLGWVAVFVVSIILLFKPWFILDSILSILISIIILKGVYKNLLKVGFILLQKFPDSLELTKIKKEIEAVELVSDIHEIKGWSIDDETHYLRFHIRVPNSTTIVEVDKLRGKIRAILEGHDVKISTIEFESENPEV